MLEIYLIFVICIFILTSEYAFADRIICKDGTVYEGIIISENSDSIIIEIPKYPIRISIFSGAVKEIQQGSEAENSNLRKKISAAKKERGFIE